MIKRIVDILGAQVGLSALLLMLPFVAIAIGKEDGWPVFIKQKRISKGKAINVWKFRSMVKNAEEMKKNLADRNERDDGPFFKIAEDPRVTKTGRFLRKTRLDEFPQFINVLKGELSLVGPRPHEPEEIEKYPEKYKHIPLEKAGLTCLSQITGKPFLPFEEEMELDLAYIKAKSLKTDLGIIAKTLGILLTKRDGI